jgi:hypothetical protein
MSQEDFNQWWLGLDAQRRNELRQDMWMLAAAAYEAGCSRPIDAQPSTDPWKAAVDHELSAIHSTADSFPSPKAAVQALIQWHVDVATDPIFNNPTAKDSAMPIIEHPPCEFTDKEKTQ